MSACPWEQFEPATISWCEERLCEVVREPSNAWSNLAFFAVALWVAWRRDAFPKPLQVSAVLASSVLAFSSFAFHATGTRWAELADVASMYMLPAIALAAFAARKRWVEGRLSTVMPLGLWGTSSGLMVATGSNGILVFGLLVAAGVAVEAESVWSRRSLRHGQRYLVGFAACFAAGFGFWLVDTFRLSCNPQNHMLTGHAVWHVMTALALAFYLEHLAVHLRAAEGR